MSRSRPTNLGQVFPAHPNEAMNSIKPLHLTRRHYGVSEFNVSPAAAAGELNVWLPEEADMQKWMRRTLVGLAVLFGPAGAAFFLWPAPVQPDVSLKTLTRLDPGMSAAQVAAEIGPSVADVTDCPPAGVPPAAPGGRLLTYSGDRATATVEFGPDGRLVRFHPVIRTINLEERIRIRLNWWW